MIFMNLAAFGQCPRGVNPLFILIQGSGPAPYEPGPAMVMVKHLSHPGSEERVMFSLLRAVVIIGAIFYYSPVRQSHGDAWPLDGLLAWGTQKVDSKSASTEVPAADAPARLETMWKALPDSAKQAVIDKIMATSGLGAGTPSVPAGDTLKPSDRQLPWRGDGKKSSS